METPAYVLCCLVRGQCFVKTTTRSQDDGLHCVVHCVYKIAGTRQQRADELETGVENKIHPQARMLRHGIYDTSVYKS